MLTALELPDEVQVFVMQVIGRQGRSLSLHVRKSFCDEISSLSLVKECEELEEMMTKDILRRETIELREMKEQE